MRAMLIAVVLAISLQGCVRSVHSDVAVFHSLPSAKSYGTVFFSAPNEEVGQTLEFRAHAAMLAGKMAPLGFRVVDSIENADYIGVLSYAINSGQQETNSYTIPVYGSTTSYVAGYAIESYGRTGYETVTEKYDVYTRQVGLDLFDVRENKDKPVKVFEARATSKGRCATVAAVLPNIVDAILKEFPGTSGTTQRVVVPSEAKC